MRHAIVAGGAAATISGAPSTLYALAVGDDPLEPTLAAGSILLPRETRRAPLVAAAIPVHLALSLGWALVLERTLPRHRTTAWGALAGLAIGALDLAIGARLFPRVRALPQLPQYADHVLYGATVGYVLSRCRAASAPSTGAASTRSRSSSPRAA